MRTTAIVALVAAACTSATPPPQTTTTVATAIVAARPRVELPREPDPIPVVPITPPESPDETVALEPAPTRFVVDEKFPKNVWAATVDDARGEWSVDISDWELEGATPLADALMR